MFTGEGVSQEHLGVGLPVGEHVNGWRLLLAVPDAHPWGACCVRDGPRGARQPLMQRRRCRDPVQARARAQCVRGPGTAHSRRRVDSTAHRPGSVLQMPWATVPTAGKLGLPLHVLGASVRPSRAACPASLDGRLADYTWLLLHLPALPPRHLHGSQACAPAFTRSGNTARKTRGGRRSTAPSWGKPSPGHCAETKHEEATVR